MAEKTALGARLRILRKERNLTQRELARQAGVSVNAISLIERNEISPSVSTLQNLATALKVKLSFFFDDDQSSDVIYLKRNDHPTLTSGGVTIKGLGQKLAGQQIEPFTLILAPQAVSGDEAIVHSGQEFVYCLQGSVEYRVDGQIYVLEPGDILFFDASLPHRWANPTIEEAQVLLVLQACEEIQDPVKRHFHHYPSLSHIG